MRVWSVAVLVIFAMFAGCANTEELQEFGEIDAPDIPAGAVFAYDMQSQVHEIELVTVNGEVVEDDDNTYGEPRGPFMTLQVLNTSFGPDGDHYLLARQAADVDEEISINGLSTIFGKAPIAMRKADLQYIPVTTDQQQVCDPGCRLATTSMTLGEPELDKYLDFPLFAGKSWITKVPFGDVFDEGLGMELHSKAIGTGTYAGPDGDLEVIRIRTTISAPDLVAFERLLEQELSEGGVEDVDIDMGLDGEQILLYAPDIGAGVQDTISMTLSLRLRGSMDGETVDANTQVDLLARTTLAAYDLTGQPELDTAGIYDFFDHGVPLRDPTGNGSAVASYTITVSADDAEINAAKDDTIKFTVDASRSLPAGHTIRYTVTDGSGEASDSGTGGTFEVEFSGPGLYAVTVQAVDGNGLVQAADAMLVAVDHQASTDASCGTLVLAAAEQGTCPTVTAPFGGSLGLQGATISVSAKDTLQQGGTLTITDGSGTALDFASDDGSVAVALDDLSTLDVATAWTVAWAPEAAAQETATFTVDVDYGPESTEGPGTQDAGTTFLDLQGRLLGNLHALL